MTSLAKAECFTISNRKAIKNWDYERDKLLTSSENRSEDTDGGKANTKAG